MRSGRKYSSRVARDLEKKGPMPHEGGHRARGTRRRFKDVRGWGLLRTRLDITRPL
jgi:hypothetical protein